MKLASLALLTMVGCVAEGNGSGENTDPPVPTFENATPTQGDYGTEVVVRGQNLQLRGVRIQANDTDGNIVNLWQSLASVVLDPSTGKPVEVPPNAPATFNFPFPAEGEMTMTYQGTTTSLGAFVPKWKPGKGYALNGEQVLGSAALPTQTIALVTSQAKGLAFVIFDDAEPRVVPIDPVNDMESAVVRTTADGKVEAVVAARAQKPLLVTLAGVAATSTPLAMEGTFLGAGLDNGDFVVVMQTSDAKVQRYRNGTIDGDAVPLPSEQAQHHVALVSGDGTVVAARDGAGGSTFDDVADFSIQALGPKDTAFSPSVQIASLDDVATQLDGKVIGGVIELSYCAVDSGWFSASETHCGKSYTVNGKDVIEPQIRDKGIAVQGGRVAQTSCNGTNQLTIDGVPALYPCGVGTVQGLALTESSARILISTNNKLYAARQR